jgi:23S rRNA (adenine2503-C2)-methyltransferase
VVYFCIKKKVFMTRFLLGETVDSLKNWLTEAGEPAFRAKQIIEWMWKKGELSASKMTNLSLPLREKIAQEFCVEPMTLYKTEESADGETKKFLWKLHDELFVESVLIGSPTRYTICVSSQVGCPARCSFCASGKKGWLRNLSTAEIVFQVLAINKYLLEKGEKVTNVVYMGMGEPLKNFDEVVASIRLLTDENYFGFSRRRITLSTVGVVEGIYALAKEDLGVSLAFSLHAPTQEKREKIIPFAREYELEDILKAVDFYRDETHRDVTYEYILLAGVNDSAEDALSLAKLLREKKGCSVNLIPYNPIPGIDFQTSPRGVIDAFRSILERQGILVTCRYRKGDDIAAACGQLAMQ